MPSPCSFPLTAGYLSSTGCFSTPISFTDTSLGDPTDWSWNFDDLVSGVSNTSILQNPTHAFSAVGAYNVELIVTRGCRSDTIVSSISVTGGTAPTISADVDICEAESTTLSVAGGADFVWSTSSSRMPASHVSDCNSAKATCLRMCGCVSLRQKQHVTVQ